MTEESLRSIKVSGSATVTGGIYDTVKGSGSVRVDGDVKARRIDLSGSSKSQGSWDTDWLHASGSVHVDGDLQAHDGQVSGSFHLGGSLISRGMVKFSGATHIGGGVSGQALEGSGSLTVQQGIEMEQFRWSGSVQCAGLLSAETVTMRLGGYSSVGELAGTSVEVRNGQGVPFLSWIRGRGIHLTVGEVSGDTVFLESTEARLVRGDRVEIGAGCRIDRVEYTERLIVHADAEVQDRVQLNPKI